MAERKELDHVEGRSSITCREEEAPSRVGDTFALRCAQGEERVSQLCGCTCCKKKQRRLRSDQYDKLMSINTMGSDWGDKRCSSLQISKVHRGYQVNRSQLKSAVHHSHQRGI